MQASLFSARLVEARATPLFLGVGGRQAFFCVPAIAAIPPDISDVGGPTHQTEARQGCEIALIFDVYSQNSGPPRYFC
jgi:hypothetical protein